MKAARALLDDEPLATAPPPRTYGRLCFAHDGKSWRVEDLPAHVSIRFKRIFPQIHAAAGGVFDLKNTDDVCADLLWFMERFPLRIASGRQQLIAGRAALRQREAEIGRILSPQWAPPGAHGFRDGRAPYGYQAQAAAVALRTGRLLLLDDVGLGKTISALAALASPDAPLPAAIVVQAHLAEQWVEDFIEPFTHLRAHVIDRTKPYNLPPADVYVFRYSNVAGWADFIATGFFRSVVFDEAQELRRGKESAKGVACANFAAADLKIGLTATPVYNYGDEIYHVLDYIAPGALGSWGEFYIEWCSGRTVKDPDALGAYLADQNITLRRTEDDDLVQQQMPKTNALPIEIPFDQDILDAEAAVARALAKIVLEGSFAASGKAARDLDMRLRKITGLAKARHVAAYVDLLLGGSDRVLLVGWHRDVYEIWNARLARHKPVMFTGSETAREKRRAKEAFCNGEARVMIMSLRSGAGLDGLQLACRDVVFGELDWSPQVHKQVIGRLRRPPQREVVTAHYLHADGGSDPALLSMLGVKADQSRGIVDPGRSLPEITTDESRIKRLAQMYLDHGEVAP